jgi:hypothetical protein
VASVKDVHGCYCDLVVESHSQQRPVSFSNINGKVMIDQRL